MAWQKKVVDHLDEENVQIFSTGQKLRRYELN